MTGHKRMTKCIYNGVKKMKYPKSNPSFIGLVCLVSFLWTGHLRQLRVRFGYPHLPKKKRIAADAIWFTFLFLIPMRCYNYNCINIQLNLCCLIPFWDHFFILKNICRISSLTYILRILRLSIDMSQEIYHTIR